MKRMLCILLTAAMLLGICGCTGPNEDIKEPVSFYYCREVDKVTYGASDGVVVREIREGSGMEDPAEILSLYLKGPQSDGLNRTFPKGVTLVSFTAEDKTAVIVLSDFFSALTGMDLTLACACLTLTVCELTGAEGITVTTETTLLDGNRSISMTTADILLLDLCDTVVDPE